MKEKAPKQVYKFVRLNAVWTPYHTCTLISGYAKLHKRKSWNSAEPLKKQKEAFHSLVHQVQYMEKWWQETSGIEWYRERAEVGLLFPAMSFTEKDVLTSKLRSSLVYFFLAERRWVCYWRECRWGCLWKHTDNKRRHKSLSVISIYFAARMFNELPKHLQSINKSVRVQEKSTTTHSVILLSLFKPL